MDALIRNKVALASACEAAKAGGFLPLDTEFVWTRTNRPILGLVQMADAAGHCQAIDCLTGLDPAPLGELLCDATIVKILHDAHQDLEHLWHWTGAKPVNVFDTQLAAAFAGFPHGIGLQRLLEEAIQVGLPKTETRTDWTQRPLSSAQIEYALDDVRYLVELREMLLARAEALGTRTWLEEDLRRYDDPEVYADPDPGEVWKRVKCGRVRLEGLGRAALRALAAVREIKAREWNLPKMWLSDDASLAELAATLPDQPRFRHRLPNKGLRETLAEAYRTALQEVGGLAESDWPDDPRPRYIPEVLAAADEALAWMRDKADDIHVDAAVIANRATVTAFVDDPEDDTNPLACGWRAEMVGAEMASRFGVD